MNGELNAWAWGKIEEAMREGRHGEWLVFHFQADGNDWVERGWNTNGGENDVAVLVP